MGSDGGGLRVLRVSLVAKIRAGADDGTITRSKEIINSNREAVELRERIRFSEKETSENHTQKFRITFLKPNYPAYTMNQVLSTTLALRCADGRDIRSTRHLRAALGQLFAAKSRPFLHSDRNLARVKNPPSERK